LWWRDTLRSVAGGKQAVMKDRNARLSVVYGVGDRVVYLVPVIVEVYPHAHEDNTPDC
jgi:hypothetical protein